MYKITLYTFIYIYIFQLSFMEQKHGLSKRQIGKQLMLLNYGAGGNYLDRKRNTEIIDIIQPKRTLESRIVKGAPF